MRSRRWQGQTNSDSTLVFPSLWSHLMLSSTQSDIVIFCASSVYVSLSRTLFYLDDFCEDFPKWLYSEGNALEFYLVLFWFRSLTLVFGHAVHLSHHRAAFSATQNIFLVKQFTLLHYPCLYFSCFTNYGKNYKYS